MKTSTLLSFAAVAATAVSANIVSECTDSTKSWVLVRDGLSDFKALSKAGDKKVAFIVSTSSLADAKPVAKKLGEKSVVWTLTEEDLKPARKLRHKSKKLKSTVKKMLKSYKSQTGKKLRFVIVPKKTSSKIVKAFEKRNVTVIRAAHNAKNSKKTKSLIKKARKNEKKGKTPVGGIVVFTVKDKNNAKQLKKLRKALSLVNAKKCFKPAKNGVQSETETETEPEKPIETSVGQKKNDATNANNASDAPTQPQSPVQPQPEPSTQTQSPVQTQSVNESQTQPQSSAQQPQPQPEPSTQTQSSPVQTQSVDGSQTQPQSSNDVSNA